MKKTKKEKQLKSPVQFLINGITPLLNNPNEHKELFSQAVDLENQTAQQLVDMGGIFFSMLIDKHLEFLEQDIDLKEYKGMFTALRSDLNKIVNNNL
jgi:hypothetical protein